MARRERTTGLPRAERRQRRATSKRTFAGIPLDDRTARVGLFGGALALLVVVLGMFGWFWYQDNYVRPDKVVLRVDDREVDLRYYADRLYQFATANPDAGSTLSQQLLNKLEEEELTVILAEREGIDLSDEAVERFIGLELAGPDATEPLTGNEYTAALRDVLRTTGFDRDVYERVSRASLATQELLAGYREDIGTTGETIDFRVVVLGSEEDANAALERVNGGEAIGTVAQELSLDLESRQNDGLQENRVVELLLDDVKTAFEGKVAGDLVGPFQVEDDWWLVRVEERNAEGELSEADQENIAQLRLDEALDALKSELSPTRNLSASDFDWAADNIDEGAI